MCPKKDKAKDQPTTLKCTFYDQGYCKYGEKCNKIPILKFPAIELSKDAIWASQIMQKLAMQNLSRLVMGA